MRGVGEPRWCGNCKLVIIGKYLSDYDGEHLVCGRCAHSVRVDETPDDTVLAVQRDAFYTPAGLALLEAITKLRSAKELQRSLADEHDQNMRQHSEILGRLNAARGRAEVLQWELDELVLPGEPRRTF